MFGIQLLRALYVLIIFTVALPTFGAAKKTPALDKAVRELLKKHKITTPDTGGGHTDARIELGRALFFDRELSGNRDTSCATCHHPRLAGTDRLSLPVGTGPLNPGALGVDRVIGLEREFVPRNAPEIFNRGSELWTSMFWDSRLALKSNGDFKNPTGKKMLPGLTSALYMQAMLPVTSRDEMRGQVGDIDIFGDENELALVPNSNPRKMWRLLMDRLMSIPRYQDMFEAAYPDKSLVDMTFADAANAIGAFEIAAFTFTDAPFDQYLDGDNTALTKKQKRGAKLFFGKAKCVSCHSGPLLTDQKHWSLGVPQLGPGKGAFAPLDVGRFAVTLKPRDMFAFRTPPLRNVARTAPYMHNGTFRDLESVIRHHASPKLSLMTYSVKKQIRQEDVRHSLLLDLATRALLLGSVDSDKLPYSLTDRQVDELEAFLHSLTAPQLGKRLRDEIPETVPSGLPVEDL